MFSVQILDESNGSPEDNHQGKFWLSSREIGCPYKLQLLYVAIVFCVTHKHM